MKIASLVVAIRQIERTRLGEKAIGTALRLVQGVARAYDVMAANAVSLCWLGFFSSVYAVHRHV